MSVNFISKVEHHFDSNYFNAICERLPVISRRLVKKSIIKNQDEAEKLKGNQVLYLSNHRSHFDYIQQIHNFWHLGLPIPKVAARENVFIPVLGEVWRKCGAFKLPLRKMSPEEAHLMREYLEHLITTNSSVLIYPEGGRSYTGEIKSFKSGGIGAVLHVAKKEGIDMFVSPQYIAYEPTIEANFFPRLQHYKERSQLIRYQLTDLFAFALRLIPPARGSVTHTFGEPFPLLDCENKKEVCERARSSILEMHETYQKEKQTAHERLRARQDSRPLSLRKAMRYLESFLG